MPQATFDDVIELGGGTGTLEDLREFRGPSTTELESEGPAGGAYTCTLFSDPAPETSGTQADDAAKQGHALVRALFQLMGRQVTPALFRAVVKARGERRSHLFERLVRVGDPAVLLQTAIQDYETFGNDDRLGLAASAFARMGQRSIPTIERLAVDDSPYAEVFLPAIQHLRGVSADRRQSLLDRFAQSVHQATLDVLQSIVRSPIPR